MAKLYLYKSRVRKDDQGRPLWVKCDSEAGCIQMAKNGLEVKMIEFKGSIPRPAHKDDFELEGVGFGARKKKRKRNKRMRALEAARRQEQLENDGIISIKRHGNKGKGKGKGTRKRQRGRRRH